MSQVLRKSVRSRNRTIKQGGRTSQTNSSPRAPASPVPSPPANKSLVLPCALNVARGTPPALFVDPFAPAVASGSVPSDVEGLAEEEGSPVRSFMSANNEAARAGSSAADIGYGEK